MIGSHYIKSWSKSQSVIALSSAEAELYAIIKTASETLGIISILKDWDMMYKADIMADASAALGIIGRTGLGKLRHIDTSYLWLQQESIKKIDVNADQIEPHSLRFIELSPLQQKVFLRLKELQGKKRITEPVYMEEFAEKLDCPISSLKKAIQRLEKTGGIKREKFKHGRGGWTIYSVSTQVELESN